MYLITSQISQFLARQQEMPPPPHTSKDSLSPGEGQGLVHAKMPTKPLLKKGSHSRPKVVENAPVETPLVKKYRRFSKLNYSSEVEDGAPSVPEVATTPPSVDTREVRIAHPSVVLATEVEFLIDDALAPRSKQSQGRSSSPGRSVRQSVRSGPFSPDKTWRERSNSPVNNSHRDAAVTIAPSERLDTPVKGILKKPSSVRVIKAVGLEETISGCSPYVVIDWGELGSASTPTAHEKTDPVYNHTLHFGKLASHAEVPSLNVFVYHKNISVSDEILGTGHLSSMNVKAGVNTVNLFGPNGIEAGKVILDIML